MAMLTRWVVSVHFAALGVQVLSALAFVGGHAGFFDLHRGCAWIVGTIAALQGAVMLVLGILRRVSRLYTAYAVVAVLVALVQQRIFLPLSTVQHVSLAMVYWGLSLALLVKVWTPAWTEGGLHASP